MTLTISGFARFSVLTLGLLSATVLAQVVGRAPIPPASTVPAEADQPSFSPLPTSDDHDAPGLSAFASAPSIVDAELVAARVAPLPGLRALATTYRFRVAEYLRGTFAAARPNEFEVTEIGGVRPDGSGLATCRSHRLQVGGRYLLALRGDAATVQLPISAALQVLDHGSVIADAQGRVLALDAAGAPVFRARAGVRTLQYLSDPHTATAVNEIAPPTPRDGGAAFTVPAAPARTLRDLSAADVAALLRAPDAAPLALPAPGLASVPSPFEPRFNTCGWIGSAHNFFLLLPADDQWNWFLGSATDWNDQVDPTNPTGSQYLVGVVFDSNSQPIRDHQPFLANGLDEAGNPTDAELTFGGYGTWASLGSPNGICFRIFSGGACARIIETDTFVNPVNNGNEPQFRKTLTHELGHALGLDHEDRYPAIMVAGTWRVPPNYVSYRYARVDDLEGIRSRIAYANTQSPGSFREAQWSDMATYGQSHPSIGNSADVQNYMATISETTFPLYRNVTLSRLYVENRGTASAGQVQLRVYFSLNPIISVSDYLVFTGGWSSFPGRTAWNDGSVTFKVPDTVPPGTYYVGWMLEAVNLDLDASNNIAVMSQPYSGGFAPRTITVTAVPPPNDLCTSPTVVSAGAYTGTNAHATLDGFSTCGNTSTSRDVWFRFNAQKSGAVTVNTCGSDFDTVLSLHSACPGNIATQLACNDDAEAGPCFGDRQSQLTFNAVAGASYWIRVTGFNGASGRYTLNVLPATCRGDLNNDQVVDDIDFVYFAQAYDLFACPNPAFCPADFNNDGIVDDIDFVLFAQAYDLYLCP